MSDGEHPSERDALVAALNALTRRIGMLTALLDSLPDRLADATRNAPTTTATAASVGWLLRHVYDRLHDDAFTWSSLLASVTLPSDRLLYEAIAGVAGEGPRCARRLGRRCALYARRNVGGYCLTKLGDGRDGAIWSITRVTVTTTLA